MGLMEAKNATANQEDGVVIFPGWLNRVATWPSNSTPTLCSKHWRQIATQYQCVPVPPGMVKVNAVCRVHRLWSRETSCHSSVDLGHEKEALSCE